MSRREKVETQRQREPECKCDEIQGVPLVVVSGSLVLVDDAKGGIGGRG